MSFEFHNPEFLYLLLLLPLLAVLKGRTGKAAALLFSSVAIAQQASAHRRTRAGKLLLGLRLLALGSFIIALARPQLGEGHSEVDASGVDIVLAVDVSSSMLALDFTRGSHPTTRLEAVKGVIKEFIDKRPYDRIGLIAFAGNPYLVSPLTLNHDWLKQNVARLQVGLVEDGTAIGSALGMSVNRLRDLPAESRLVILLTDGYNNRGKVSPLAAAEAAASFNTKVYTIAAGEGGVVPTLYLDRHGNIARDRRGNFEIVPAEIPIDQESLKEIAAITGAKYFHARDHQQLSLIYDEIDRLEKTEVKLSHYADYRELYPWLVLVGLLILGLEQLLATTRFRRLP